MATVNDNESNAYFMRYITLAKEGAIEDALTASHADFLQLLSGIREEQSMHRYAEGKWSIKELLLHIIDTERIFVNRAVRIARGDKTMLPGYDENTYAANSGADARSFASLVSEYKLQRASTLAFFGGVDELSRTLIGNASGGPISVRALGYMLAGHEIHHQKVIVERYL